VNEQQIGTDTLIEKTSPIQIEEQGYDAPFATFTWEHWQEMQAHMLQRFTRFQRAIEYRQADIAVQISQEVIVMGLEWLEEATGWVGVKPK